MEAMKDSGNRWIGQIPLSWDTKRIKYLATLKGRIGWQGLTSDEYQDEGAFLITGVDFRNGGIDWESCEHVPMKRWEEAKDIQIKNGDLLITKDGTIGKVAIVSDMPGETSLNSGVLRIMTYEGYNRKYLYWVLQSEVFWNWFNYKNSGNSTIQHLYQGDFAEFVYSYPQSEEQQAIADFLDDKCGQIDGIIADIEQQIELLKNYKKSLITETVTKGLDKNVNMKYSGVEWIGKIPEHWDVKRLKYVLENGEMRVGPFGSTLSTTDYVENGKWVYNQRLVLDENFKENDICISDDKYKELIGFRVFPGDVLITTRGTIGKTTIVPEGAPEGVLHPCIIRFRTDKEKTSNELIRLIFNETDLLKNQVEYMSNSTTIEVIYSYSLKEVSVPVIPYEEQKIIISCIKEKMSYFDSIIATKQTQLTQMQQHKKSLIYEYVTGKKRVGGFGNE